MSEPERAVQPSGSAPTPKTVLFVCPHGAGKSRLAAAFFNAAVSGGWRATSAGQHPAAAVNERAVALVAGMPAGAAIDHEPPRAIATVAAPARTISIDCDVAGAERWTLDHQALDEEGRDEIRLQAEALVRTLAEVGTPGGFDA